MVEVLAYRIIRKIGQAAELKHRFVLLETPAGADRTAALEDAHELRAAPLSNVDLEQFFRMLDLTERERALTGMGET